MESVVGCSLQITYHPVDEVLRIPRRDEADGVLVGRDVGRNADRHWHVFGYVGRFGSCGLGNVFLVEISLKIEGGSERVGVGGVYEESVLSQNLQWSRWGPVNAPGIAFLDVGACASGFVASK
eukprot:TRINITY_DN39663_c0_g1_i5.p1 TRINITY_DN39663_c0_g1~~TRINITY_DN39663_c0_g1_i5.p1  ORF type:complete len:123 (+),score=1.73 TRINITY_DN39663_c0_g1_i5:77-445(+)